MTRLAVYLPQPGYLNEATSFYIEMICDGLANGEKNIVYNLSDLSGYDVVFVIDARSFVFVKLRHPRLKVVTWYQGVVPEEILMLSGSYIRYIYWCFLEFLSLRFSSLNIFISNAMKNHYENKYRHKISKSLVIPCFNKELAHDIVMNDSLSFVYAGGLHKWQCIDRMLNIFSIIQAKEPNATLDFYTFNVAEAKKIVDSLNLNHVTLKTASLNEIDKLISKSKYGFIIRENHIVNNVATPTKLSTYLSVGTKPIITDVIFDFRMNVSRDVCVRVNWSDTDIEIAESIVSDHNNKDASGAFISARKELFKNYLNRSVYVDKLRKLII